MHATVNRTAILIEEAKRAGARSYMARFKAMSIAEWALVLRRDAGILRQGPTSKGKKRQQEG